MDRYGNKKDFFLFKIASTVEELFYHVQIFFFRAEGRVCWGFASFAIHQKKKRRERVSKKDSIAWGHFRIFDLLVYGVYHLRVDKKMIELVIEIVQGERNFV